MISTHTELQDLGESSTHFQACLTTREGGPVSTFRCAPDINHEFQGARAGNDIPVGISVVIESTELVLGHDLIRDEQDDNRVTCVNYVKVYWRNGRLEKNSKDSPGPSWIHSVRSARDRHEQNMELLRGTTGLYAYTMRPIGRGQQLLIWYGEGLAIEVGIPVLTPCNIRGHQEYVCTGCQATFTYPNVLKAHMALQCSESPVAPASRTDTLTPFHQILQTICKTSFSSAAMLDKVRHVHKSKDNRFTSSTSSCLRQGCSDCTQLQQELSYKSAFKAPSSARREVKREVGSEDGLMTPDSSTDQSSALNLCVKPTEVCGPSEESSDPPAHTSPHWNAFTAQQMMAQSISLPFDYTQLTACYQTAPHLHALGIRLMSCGQNLQQTHAYGTSLERAVCSKGDFSLIPPQIDDVRERMACSLSSFKLHSPNVAPSVRQARPNNPYGFELPSDKEPLDLLPQAYFANKSKKGHLCLCCGKLYSRKYGLKIHMRTHNGYKPLKCKICARPFGDPSNLNKHVRLHAQGETPYRCEYCGKVLVRRRDLERHVRSRHPVGGVDEARGLCESSPDSSPVSVESSENSLAPKEPS